MTEFTASNGYTVRVFDDKVTLIFDGNGEDIWIDHVDQQALREFFQHERDEELGRWRWPEKPEFVVYGDYSRGEEQRFLRVIHELDGAAVVVYEQGSDIRPNHPAAQAYFEAHPERKPWEDAKTGEGWVLNFPAGPAVALRRSDGIFYDYEGNRLFTDRVSEARRIWPEGDAS